MNKMVNVSSWVKELDIDLNYGELYFENGQEFSLQIECTEENEIFAEENGVCLRIWNERKNKRITISQKHTDPLIVKITIPEGTSFEKVRLETGAVEFTADTLIVDSLIAKMGAGEFQIENLQVSNFAQIDGGAGEITIENGTIHNLNMNLGAGEVGVTAAITGDSKINAGVGELVLKLLGSPDDYSATITKGLGSCAVNGFTYCNGNTYGDGENHLKVSGGVGSVNVSFC